MFTKTVMTLAAAAVLAASLGSNAVAQNNGQEWWKAYNEKNTSKRCVQGEESASSAYPSWMRC